MRLAQLAEEHRMSSLADTFRRALAEELGEIAKPDIHEALQLLNSSLDFRFRSVAEKTWTAALLEAFRDTSFERALRNAKAALREPMEALRERLLRNEAGDERAHAAFELIRQGVPPVEVAKRFDVSDELAIAALRNFGRRHKDPDYYSGEPGIREDINEKLTRVRDFSAASKQACMEVLSLVHQLGEMGKSAEEIADLLDIDIGVPMLILERSGERYLDALILPDVEDLGS